MNIDKNISVHKTAKEIKERIDDLGRQIKASYGKDTKEITVVGIMKGSSIFYADLVRAIDMHLACEFLCFASYDDEEHFTGTGEAKIILDLSAPIGGKDILLIEDIVDTGLDLHYIYRYLEARKPKSIKTCCLVVKPKILVPELKVDFTGFEVADEFIFGYGIDYQGLYRNLPYLGMLPKGEK